MQRRSGIRRKIWAVFVLQLAAISFATILGVYGAATVLQDVLIKRALLDEAGHYFRRLEADPSAQLPDTYNMRGYLVGRGGSRSDLPEALRDLEPGYQRVVGAQRNDLVFVTEGPPGWLFLVFHQEQVDKLAFLFGFVPLSVVLLIIYLTTWFTYRASRRALSPVIGLANAVRNWDPKHPDLEALSPENLSSDPDGDVETLAKALHGYASRIEEFVDRERNFTRDASHELRSPLTVIKMAGDLLLDDERLSAFSRRTAMRIKSAARDMEVLIEAFLILAREGDTGLPEEDFVMNELVHDEVDRAHPLLEGKPVQLRCEEAGAFALHAPPKVCSVMIGNLLRNACAYTEQGTIVVTIGADFVCIEDTGLGMSEDELQQVFQPYFRAERSSRGGHGIGMTIVKRLSDRFGWPVELQSRLGVGTTATIRFPNPQPL
jgi:signal transduction histidine kinase